MDTIPGRVAPDHSRVALLTGGTGFIGQRLCRRLIDQGWQVIVLVHRSALPDSLHGARVIASLDEVPPDQQVDVVVNLAGARILGPPWTRRRRRLLLESRINTTTTLVQWLSRRTAHPQVLVNASAVGYYGVRGAERLTESALPQPIFQSQLCSEWEEAARRCAQFDVRCVMLRFGVVLGNGGGALPAFVRPARLGLAAVLGDGQQGFPWIHIDDALGLIQWVISHDIHGAVNVVAPQLVSQRQFQQELSKVLHRKQWLRMPAWPLRLVLGEMSQLLVDGQYVEPASALESGFVFGYPDLRGALASLLAA